MLSLLLLKTNFNQIKQIIITRTLTGVRVGEPGEAWWRGGTKIEGMGG